MELFGYLDEQFTYASVLLGGYLLKGSAYLFCELISLLRRNLDLIKHIRFISHKKFKD